MQGIDINNSSLQQHAVNLTYPLKASTGDLLDGLELWVPDGHLYIIDNLIITNGHSSSVTATIYLAQHGQSANSYTDFSNTHFLHDDWMTPAASASESVRIWRKAQAAHTSDRPFGDSPFYLMAGQALSIYVDNNGTGHATYSFRDCF